MMPVQSTHVLVIPEHGTLLEHCIHQGSLAVVCVA